MVKFNQVTEPVELEFFSIEDDGHGGKDIHVLGYLYSDGENNGKGEWRCVEFSFFIEPLEDFIRHYAETENYVDNTAGGLKQYIEDMTDEEAVETINHYFGGNPADGQLFYSDITIETPCGNYCFEL